jgi:hypothetical protein
MFCPGVAATESSEKILAESKRRGHCLTTKSMMFQVFGSFRNNASKRIKSARLRGLERNGGGRSASTRAKPPNSGVNSQVPSPAAKGSSVGSLSHYSDDDSDETRELKDDFKF